MLSHLEQKFVRLRVPDAAQVGLGELSSAVRESLRDAPTPFAPEVVDFSAAFSSRLFRDAEARLSGELQSLAFFMRRSRLDELQSRFERMQSPASMLAARGVAFHIPPSNVSAILGYSWLMSVLTGNVNVIRMPSSPTREHLILARVFNELASEAGGAMRRNTYIVEYGHDEEITAALSALADVRVIWGGDATVNRLRAVPLPPGAKELTFPDKHSLALISAADYAATSEAGRDRLAAAFYNDTFWFDQMACSSPRLVIWDGPPETSRQLSGDFFARLTAQINARQYSAGLHTAITKDAFSCAAILDQGVTAYDRYSNELTVLTVDSLESLTREHCGGGVLFQYFTDGLDPVLAFVTRRDQTLSHYNYTGPQLADLARGLKSRGIDRIVPIGKALEFQSTWDGYDLLQEFSRRIYIEAAAPLAAATT